MFVDICMLLLLRILWKPSRYYVCGILSNFILLIVFYIELQLIVHYLLIDSQEYMSIYTGIIQAEIAVDSPLLGVSQNNPISSPICASHIIWYLLKALLNK